MSIEEKKSFLCIGLKLQGINVSEELLERVILSFDIINKKKGEASLMDFAKIESDMRIKYGDPKPSFSIVIESVPHVG